MFAIIQLNLTGSLLLVISPCFSVLSRFAYIFIEIYFGMIFNIFIQAVILTMLERSSEEAILKPFNTVIIGNNLSARFVKKMQDCSSFNVM